MKKFFLFVAIATLMSSCSKNLVPWTNQLSRKYDIGPEKVQLYISENVTLTQDSANLQVAVDKGKIKATKNVKIDEVLIKQGEKGVAVTNSSVKNGDDPKKKILASFEKGDSYFLSFVPNPLKKDTIFTISAEKWTKGVGTVTYNDTKYFTANNSAYLLVDLKALLKVSKKSRVAKGRKVQ